MRQADGIHIVLHMLAFMSGPSLAGLTCHIHPPVTEQTDAQPQIVGPFSSTRTCEKANAMLFSGKGRCHCSFGTDSMLPRGRNAPSTPEDPAPLP